MGFRADAISAAFIALGDTPIWCHFGLPRRPATTPAAIAQAAEVPELNAAASVRLAKL